MIKQIKWTMFLAEKYAAKRLSHGLHAPAYSDQSNGKERKKTNVAIKLPPAP
jgi:hypothetical protein